MDFETIRKYIKPYLTPVNIGVFALLLLGIILLVLVVFTRSNTDALIAENQIQIKRGEKIITINENGLVEYKSDAGTFYETWDSQKTNSFFSNMRARAREYLENPTGPIEGGYEVTLWIDGELVTFYISGDDEELGEVFEEFGDEEGVDLSGYFEEDEDEDEDGQIFSSPTPTLLFGISPTLTPTITPGSNGDSGTEQLPPDCDLYGEYVTGRTVITNTLCQIEQ